MVTWTLRVRTDTLTDAAIVQDWTGTLVERYNRPDTLQIEGEWGHLAPLCIPGYGCTLEDANGIRLSGLTEDWAVSSSRDEGERVVVSIIADTQRAWERIAFPAPGVAWDVQNVAYDVRTGPSETVALAYLDANLGAGSATVSRRLTGLSVPVSAGRGRTLTHRARFDNLGELLSSLLSPDGLRLRLISDGSGGITADVDTCPDLTSVATFGTHRTGGPGRLSSWQYTVSRPKGTRALVAAGGEGVGRMLDVYADVAAEALWASRVEMFVDQRQTTVRPEALQAGQDAVLQAAKQVEIRAEVADVAGARLGVDVPVGALVGVDVGGQFVGERVQAITTSITPEGDVLSAVIGSEDGALTRTQRQWLASGLALRKVQAR